MNYEKKSKQCQKLNINCGGLTLIKYEGGIAFWNKFNIYLFKSTDLKEDPISLTVEFYIIKVMILNNFLVILDSNGFIHIISLKIKKYQQKHLHIDFKPREQGVLAFEKVSETKVITFQIIDTTAHLCYHNINSDFKQISVTSILNLMLNTTKMNTFLFLTYTITSEHYNIIKSIFNVRDVSDNSQLVIFSPDSKTLFGTVSNMKDLSLNVVKIYISPIVINSVHVVNDNGIAICIVLCTGTLVILVPKESKFEQKFIHLNSAVTSSIILKENSLLFTDGCTLGKVNNLHSEVPSFKELFIRNPKNFIEYENQVICLTYSNNVYTFNINDTSIYYENRSNKNFVTLPENMEQPKLIMQEIMKEINNNEEVLEKIKQENHFTTTLALSRRTELLDKHIILQMKLYDNYEEAISEHENLTLANNVQDYFIPGVIINLINFSVSEEFKNRYFQIYSTVNLQMRLHIEINNGQDTIMTTIPCNCTTCGLNVLIPFKLGKTSQVKVNTKLIVPIPDIHEKKKMFWSVLFSKENCFSSENFIKCQNDDNKVKILSHPTGIPSAIKAVFDSIDNHSLNDNSIKVKEMKVISYIIRMSRNYEEKLIHIETYKKYLSKSHSSYFHKILGSENFLKKRQKICVQLGKYEVTLRLSISADYGHIILVSSSNMRIAADIRNFISKLVYGKYEEFNEFLIPHMQYTKLENLKRLLNDQLIEGHPNQDSIIEIADEFNKYILGFLPL